MNLPRLALRYPAVVITLVTLATLAGIYAFNHAPRREDPEFTIRVCRVVTIWPGATAEDVEKLVTDKIEEAVDTIDEVKQVESITRVGQSVIEVELDDATEDIDAIWEQIRAEIDLITPELPDGCGKPMVNSNFGDTAAIVLALYQKPPPGRDAVDPLHEYTPRQLEAFAERLQDELKLLDTVGRVELLGVQEEVIYVETDAGTWSQLALTTSELRDLLAARNIVAPGGTIDTSGVRVGVKPSGDLESVGQIERQVVALYDGRMPVHLQDLGLSVQRSYAEPPQTIARFRAGPEASTRPCVVVTATLKSGRNITVLGRQVAEVVARAQQGLLPSDIAVDLASDQPTLVNRAIDTFVTNLWQSVLIVVLVALLLVGLRVAVVMAAAIPLVMLATLGMMRFWEVQIEQMSISALIIALGMLVDNAIEVCDNTMRHQEEGADPHHAAERGASQIGFPILIATLTTVAAFAPMPIALTGGASEYIFSLPVVVSIALIYSWLLAMTLTTIMAKWLIRPTPAGESANPLLAIVGWCARLVRKPAPQRTEPGEPTYQRIYLAACRACMRNKWLTVALAFAAFGGAVSLAVTGQIGTEFFPNANRNQFLVEVWAPQGASFDFTDQACAQVEDIIAELSTDQAGDSRLQNMITYVGSGGPRFFLSFSPQAPTPNYGLIVVNTHTAAQAPAYVEAIRRAADQRVAGVRVVPQRLSMGPPVEAPIEVRVSGPGHADMTTLRDYADQVKAALRATGQVWEVRDNWGSFGYQFDVDVDEDKANAAGVTNASIAQTLNAFFSGLRLTTFREGDHQIPVYFRLPHDQRESLEQLETVYVEGQFGKVPLDSVATIDLRWQAAKIARRDQNRTITVSARPQGDVLANTVVGEAWPAIEKLAAGAPAGYRFEAGGTLEESKKTQGQVSMSFLISFVLIVLLLVVQYNAFTKPIIIFVTLPLALTGALLGLWVTGNSLSFMAQLGLLSLAGIVLNAAIVLTEFAEMLVKERIKRGDGVAPPGERSYSGLTRDAFREVIAQTGKLRITPIGLTTLTTIGGLAPLAIAGGPLFEPLATVVIAGLILATVLTLLVLPAVVGIFVENFGLDLVRKDEG